MGWERVAGDASRSQILQALCATVRSSNLTLRVLLGGSSEEEQRKTARPPHPVRQSRRWGVMVRENFLHRLRGQHPSGVGDAKQAPPVTFWNLGPSGLQKSI